jgi:serine/threonine protein kinase
MKPQPFGRFLLLDKVASGGMAEVWRAKISGESGFQRIVAIKKILPHVSDDKEFITMFTDEAKITVQLQHSNIGQVYEFNRDEEIFYISMEYISGKDLKTIWSFLRKQKAIIPLRLSCNIIQQMAEGLDYAHRKKDNFGNELGIVHRDVSPQNVIVSWDGEVKVIDFGIAKAADKSGQTRAGTLKGKFAYMCPEQIRGLALDGRADIFALGIVLYELVTGERGFQAESEFSLLEMVRNVEIKPPSMVNKDLPQELEQIIFKALTKDPDKRYRWASDLSEDLQRFLLSQGKPPNRHDLGAFLRRTFTVDYDKERLRLESYKEVEWVPPAPTPPTPAPPPSPPPASVTAVQAAMASDIGTMAGDDGSSAFHSSEASKEPSASSYIIKPQNADTQFAPALATPNARQVSKTNIQPPTRGSKGITLGLAIAGGLGLLVLVGAAAIFLFKPQGTISITVSGAPSGTVLVDGEVVGTATPNFAAKLEAGTHDVIVQQDNYVPFQSTIVIESNKRLPIKAMLVQVPGRLTISSEPPGAKILIDGVLLEKTTPASIDVSGGITHRIELQLDGFHPKVLSERLGASEQRDLSIDLKPTVLKLEILTVPSGAKVKLGSRVLGKTPVSFEYDAELPYPYIIISKPGCTTMETTWPIDRDKYKQKKIYELGGCR